MEQTQQTDAVEQVYNDSNDGASDELLSELFDDQAGQEDVAGKGDSLSLEDLNKTFGREFKSKEEALKHAANLKSFAGDQEAIKERKAQKELEAKLKEEVSTKEELANLKKDLAKKDFLIDTPTAKSVIEPLEAFAEKHKLTLVEAWQHEAFKPIAEASQRISKAPVTNNRINPVQSQAIDKLKEEVKQTGSDTAKLNLVKEYFKK